MKTIILAIISASILTVISSDKDESYNLTVEVKNLRNSKVELLYLTGDFFRRNI